MITIFIELNCFVYLAQLPPKSDQSKDKTKLLLTSLSGFGMTASNLKLTSNIPSAFPLLQPRSDVPTFNIDPSSGIYPNVTQVACYNSEELMSLLSALEASTDGGLVVIWFYVNISLRDAVGWPVDGYKLHSRVILVGESETDRPYFDMAMVPKFASVSGYPNPLVPLIGILQLVVMNIYGGVMDPSYSIPAIHG